ncbi:MAG: DUF1217 domain-containing protein [Paracoccaceae bacterium]
MSFQPVVPLPGIAGWRFLERTRAVQTAAFERSPEIRRDTDHFVDNLGSVSSAADLVSDRRLLKVALGAFGLDDDLGKRAFVRKVLEEGTDDPKSFANRLVDARYRAFAAAFGFGNASWAGTDSPGFAAEMAARYRTRQFETAIGASEPSMRLALGFSREIGEFAAAGDPDGAAWFQIMGTPPLRRVFEKAYNLPRDIGALDIDRQRELFRQKTRELFGASSLAVFGDSGKVDEFLRRFLAREQVDAGAGALAPGAAALRLLRAGPALGPRGLGNLLLSAT